MSNSDNAVNLSIAMGAPKGVMWMVKFFDERFIVKDVGPDGLINVMWKSIFQKWFLWTLNGPT